MNSYVSLGDLFATVKTIYGQYATVLDYDVQRATTSVQGFTSLMLRVTTTVKVNENTTEKTSVIVKCLPILNEQNDLISEGNMFELEILYFSKLLPLLEKRIQNLPIVKTYITYDNTIIMEDLCKSDYKTLGKSMHDVSKNLLELSHVRLVMRKLAEIHVASLDINWKNICGEVLETDAMFENSSGDVFRNMVNNACKTIIIVMKELYPEKYEKYSKWLLDPICYDTMTKLCKYDPKFINVLCHGDCWVNNMMFKLDSNTNKPVDMKFIDFQIIRYAPPTTDILYFLYTCTNKEFRDKYETEILKTYVDAFNALVCETPDRLPYEMFKEYYANTRILGVCFGIAMRTMLYMQGLFPEEDEDMSPEMFETIMFGDSSVKALQQFQENEIFRENMIEIVNETIEVMDKLNII